MVGSEMAKLFGCIMESKISTLVEKNGKRSYGHFGFRKHNSTIDHLVTLRVLMDRSCLIGRGLYCCFGDFKKAFDMVPREYVWRRIEEHEMPSEYRLAISQIF